MASLFLSYSSTDMELARKIEQELVHQGNEVWRDQERLYAGDRWPKTLGEAIAASDALVLLWSAAAAQSDFVELEWTTALALKKTILPCPLDQTPLPDSLAGYQRLDVSSIPQEAAKNGSPPASDPANTKRFLDQLSALRAMDPAQVLSKIRNVHGSVYQAGGDIYVGQSQQKSLLDKWQAWVAIVVAVAGLAFTLWRDYRPKPAKPLPAVEDQTFAGSIYGGSEPLPGVKVSLILEGKVVGSTATDRIGHYVFYIKASPDAPVTLIAQKSGFETQKRYAQLPDTNFNFSLMRVSK